MQDSDPHDVRSTPVFVSFLPIFSFVVCFCNILWSTHDATCLISPILSPDPQNLFHRFQMEYLADPEHASVSNSDTIRVREMATLMGTLCELRQFLWTSHGDFDAKF